MKVARKSLRTLSYVLCVLGVVSTMYTIYGYYKSFTEKLTVEFKGSLGDLMFQYAYGYSISKSMKKTFVVDYNVAFWETFPFLEAESKSSVLDYWSQEISACGFKQRIKLTRTMEHVCTYQSFLYVENDIRRNFAFRPELIVRSLSVLLEKRQEVQTRLAYKNFTTVGVHLSSGEIPRENSMDRAMDYFRKTSKASPIFIVISENGNWARDNVKGKDAVVLMSQGPSSDLVILTFCDHNIVTASALGWWAAFLSNGTTAYLSPQDSRSTDLYLPKWIPVQ